MSSSHRFSWYWIGIFLLLVAVFSNPLDSSLGEIRSLEKLCLSISPSWSLEGQVLLPAYVKPSNASAISEDENFYLFAGSLYSGLNNVVNNVGTEPHLTVAQESVLAIQSDGFSIANAVIDGVSSLATGPNNVVESQAGPANNLFTAVLEMAPWRCSSKAAVGNAATNNSDTLGGGLNNDVEDSNVGALDTCSVSIGSRFVGVQESALTTKFDGVINNVGCSATGLNSVVVSQEDVPANNLFTAYDQFNGYRMEDMVAEKFFVGEIRSLEKLCLSISPSWSLEGQVLLPAYVKPSNASAISEDENFYLFAGSLYSGLNNVVNNVGTEPHLTVAQESVLAIQSDGFSIANAVIDGVSSLATGPNNVVESQAGPANNLFTAVLEMAPWRCSSKAAVGNAATNNSDTLGGGLNNDVEDSNVGALDTCSVSIGSRFVGVQESALTTKFDGVINNVGCSATGLNSVVVSQEDVPANNLFTAYDQFNGYRMEDMVAEKFFVGEIRSLEKLCLSISPSWSLEGQVLLPAYVKPSNASAISEDENFYLFAGSLYSGLNNVVNNVGTEPHLTVAQESVLAIQSDGFSIANAVIDGVSSLATGPNNVVESQAGPANNLFTAVLEMAPWRCSSKAAVGNAATNNSDTLGGGLNNDVEDSNVGALDTCSVSIGSRFVGVQESALTTKFDGVINNVGCSATGLNSVVVSQEDVPANNLFTAYDQFNGYRMEDMVAEKFFVGEIRSLEKLCLSISPSWSLEGQVLLPAYVKPSNASAISEDENFYLFAGSLYSGLNNVVNNVGTEPHLTVAQESVLAIQSDGFSIANAVIDGVSSLATGPNNVVESQAGPANNLFTAVLEMAPWRCSSKAAVGNAATNNSDTLGGGLNNDVEDSNVGALDTCSVSIGSRFVGVQESALTTKFDGVINNVGCSATGLNSVVVSQEDVPANNLFTAYDQFNGYRMEDMVAEKSFVGEIRSLEKLCLSISPSWSLEGQVLLPAYVKPSNASAISEDENFYLSAGSLYSGLNNVVNNVGIEPHLTVAQESVLAIQSDGFSIANAVIDGVSSLATGFNNVVVSQAGPANNLFTAVLEMAPWRCSSKAAVGNAATNNSDTLGGGLNNDVEDSNVGALDTCSVSIGSRFVGVQESALTTKFDGVINNVGCSATGLNSVVVSQEDVPANNLFTAYDQFNNLFKIKAAAESVTINNASRLYTGLKNVIKDNNVGLSLSLPLGMLRPTILTLWAVD